MQAVILSVGDELTLGQTVDTNSAYLSARLIGAGVLTLYHQTVPDDLAAIADAVRQAADRAELVIVTGGLGPTKDDLTREALAAATGAPLKLDESSARRIEEFFRKLNRPMAESNRVQAMHPAGSDMLENPRGTAPGIRCRIGQATVVAMPGVPAEMRGMFEQHVVPLLSGASARVILTRTIHTLGFGESQVGDMLGELMDRAHNPTVGTTVSGGIVSVRIRSDFATPEQARTALERTAADVKQRLGSAAFGQDGQSIQEVVGELLLAGRRTVATAESCTGGLVGKMLTDRAGSSAYYAGGWIVYGNRLKETALGVDPGLIGREGAVSQAVAHALARAALERSGADCALALTGIAGPDGGTPDKPVGTVWIALARRTTGLPDLRAERMQFPGDREMVRDRAAKTALNMLRIELL